MKKNINIIYVIKINLLLQLQFIQNIFKNIIITIKYCLLIRFDINKWQYFLINYKKYFSYIIKHKSDVHIIGLHIFGIIIPEIIALINDQAETTKLTSFIQTLVKGDILAHSPKLSIIVSIFIIFLSAQK